MAAERCVRGKPFAQTPRTERAAGSQQISIERKHADARSASRGQDHRDSRCRRASAPPTQGARRRAVPNGTALRIKNNIGTKSSGDLRSPGAYASIAVRTRRTRSGPVRHVMRRRHEAFPRALRAALISADAGVCFRSAEPPRIQIHFMQAQYSSRLKEPAEAHRDGAKLPRAGGAALP